MTSGCVLIIDDDQLTLTMLEDRLKRKGHLVYTARSGAEGLLLLEQNAEQVETVLLDRRMPEMDGIGVVQQMKQSEAIRNIPVVMLTGADSAEEMREGLDAGVFYYLIKPAEESVLDSVLQAALRERRLRRNLFTALSQQQAAANQFMETARFHYRTMQDAEALARFLAGCFPAPERVLIGLAELLYNAVEHGNLGIGYAGKSELVAQGRLEQEIANRQALPENTHKQVEVVFQRKPEGVFVQITDTGPGFDWQNYLTIDPGRATHNHGRGIAQANAQSFDALKYNRAGNQVLAMVAAPGMGAEPLEW